MSRFGICPRRSEISDNIQPGRKDALEQKMTDQVGRQHGNLPIVSVIVPGHNAASTLRRSLSSICSQDWPKDRLELIYVDDASTDKSIDIASKWTNRTVSLTGIPHGPSAARNAGVQESSGDIIVFLDADVVAPPGTVRDLTAPLLEDSRLDAIFGSYDSEPSDDSLVSQYRNLLHHFVHQNSRREAATFWAGCGALRKQAFLSAGGFDAARYTRAMIEDIELGHRMRALGMQIQLRPMIQVKHLKKWTLFEMLRSDIFSRGIPWMRLLLMDPGTSGEIGDLNLRLSAVFSVALAYIGLFLALLSPWYPKLLLGVCATLGLEILLNLPAYRFFYRARGLWFALTVIPFHFFYHFCNALSVVAGIFCHVFIDRPLPGLKTAGAALQKWNRPLK